MKAQKFNLLNTTTSYGDLTKTFITARINTKVASGKTGLSAPFTSFAPTFDDTAGTPTDFILTPNNRLFVINTIAGGLGRVVLYDFNPATGAFSLVGSLNLTFINSPATTHTIRGFKVFDGASAGVVTGWKIFVATTGSVTANVGLYMANSIDKTDFTAVPVTIPTATLADAKQVYKLENSPFTLTQSAGVIIDTATTRIYQHNGVSATHQYAKFNYSLSTGIPGANGIITTLTEFVTGNLPALSGTLLLTNSEFRAVPVAAPNPVALLGQACAFFMTGTNAYLGRLDELTNGGTTWPSLQLSNFLTPTLLVNPTPIGGCWSNDVDRMFCNVSNVQVIAKPLQSGNIEYFISSVDSQYLEAGGWMTPVNTTLKFGGLTSTRLQAMNGWLLMLLTTTGQRGVICLPVQSDYRYLGDYIITRVIDTRRQKLIALARIRLLRGQSSAYKFQYRTSGFASQTVGWLDFPQSTDDISDVAAADEIQFRILPNLTGNALNHTDLMHEGYLITQPESEMSEYFAVSDDFTETGSPARSGFIQGKARGSAHPKLIFRAYNFLTGSLIEEKNTTDNPSFFQYTTNDGSSWNSLGTIPDAVGTGVRFNWTTPPGVKVVISLSET